MDKEALELPDDDAIDVVLDVGNLRIISEKGTPGEEDIDPDLLRAWESEEDGESDQATILVEPVEEVREARQIMRSSQCPETCGVP
ncbi:hypothetical protein T484DRAFT_1823122 [Baffinella frigidus]|nr:hypothetical protein T484DRAFT_1823122 [Cryptophyta sp. CCMP2293]